MSKKSNQFEYYGKNKMEELPKMIDFVTYAMEYFGLDEEKIFDVQMAVDEACTNIIQYAYPMEEEGIIEIFCKIIDGNFAVIIKDYGKPFNPNSVPIPDLTANLEERKEGGLGIFFMKELMDELRYEYKNGCETLIMIKYL
ncbi:MAG: ATP-binding protein [Methanosarcinales archaeon]